MDKLARQLNEDAANIKVSVSPELEDRIRASLEATVQQAPERQEARPGFFSQWWASSLTGIAAVAAIILVINLQQPDSVSPPAPTPDAVAVAGADLPAPGSVVPDWNLQNAVSTEPLREELEALEADLKKAEEAVRKDIGIFP